MNDKKEDNEKSEIIKGNKAAAVLVVLAGIIVSIISISARDNSSKQEEVPEYMEVSAQLQDFNQKISDGAVDIEGMTTDEIIDAFQKEYQTDETDEEKDIESNVEVNALTSEGQNAKDFYDVAYWTSDSKGKDTKRKYITSDEDRFILDFCENYGEIGKCTKLLNLKNLDTVDVGLIKPFSEVSLWGYEVGDGASVYILKKAYEDGIGETCIYVGENVSEYTGDAEELTFFIPSKDEEGFDFEFYEFDDFSCEKYEGKKDESQSNQSGLKYYDANGRLVYINYYMTHGNHDVVIVWDEDTVSMILDCGGMAYGPDSEDESIEIGIPATIYYFSPEMGQTVF